MSQKPAISSFVSVKGPSVTVRFPPPWNVMRAPLELGWSPSAASITPAFTISWLNSSMAATSSLLGRTPASLFLSALMIIMNRIVVSPSGLRVSTRCDPDSYSRNERGAARSTRREEYFLGARLSARNAKCLCLTTGHGPHDQKRLGPRRDRVGQRSVQQLVGQILLAGEEPHERSAL